MKKITHVLFAIVCLGSLFAFSKQFTDPYIVPKWCFVVFVLLVIFVYEAVKSLFDKQNKLSKMDFSTCGYIIVFFCFLEAVLGIVQFWGLFQGSSIYKVTGSFDNPAGFAASLCAGFSFIIFLLSEGCRKHVRHGGWMIGAIIAVAVTMSQSRAGVMSVAFICFTLLYLKFSRKRWIRILSMGCFALLLSGCYWLKKDSAEGRLLIWKCSMHMVKDSPWIGHGIGGFEAHYMDYQKDYLRQHEQSRYSMLAGNVKHPFNEYIGVLVNFGFIGLLMILAIVTLLVHCYRKYPSAEKRIALYSLMSIGVFSFFSYPFTYPFTWIVTSLCVVILTKEYLTIFFTQPMMKNALCIFILIGSFGGIYKLVERVKSEIEWGKIAKLALCEKSRKTLPAYEKLEMKFEDNPYFLYNYAAILLENKQYEESIKIALRCRKYWADYDLELMIGELYQNLDIPELAEKYYNSALLMCPSRFLPLYNLFHLYKDIEDRECMFSVAKTIIDKPMKIETPTIRMMKREMEREQAQLLTEERATNR